MTRAAAPTTPGVLVSIDDVTVDEGTERNYTVRLTTRPSDPPVTVAITVAAHPDNPEGAGADVGNITVPRNELSFTAANWNRLQNVTIIAAEDDDEITEIVNINHNIGGTGSYADVDVVAIKVTATDNDVVTGAAIRVDRTAVSLTENDDDDGSAMVMVRLAVEPTGDVTVAVDIGRWRRHCNCRRKSHVYGFELG